ncbi:hypothetical protein DSECCO2_598920 [anaerobic digester metagenome]
MIYMCMGKENIVDFTRTKWQVPVHGIRFQTLALKNTTIEENFFSFICFNEKLAAGYLLRTTNKCNFHSADFILLNHPAELPDVHNQK